MPRLVTLLSLASVTLAGLVVSSTGRAESVLVRSRPNDGCRFEGAFSGALAADMGEQPFVTLPSPADAKVFALGIGPNPVRVSVETDGWRLTGVLAGQPLALYLRRPVLFEGLYLAATDEPLTFRFASDGSAYVSARLPEEYGLERTFEESVSCGNLSLAPTPQDEGSLRALLGRPKARSELVVGTERLELRETFDGKNPITIDARPTWDVEVLQRKAEQTRVRIGQVVGWIRNELLAPFESVDLLNMGAVGDPNAPTAPWGHELPSFESNAAAHFVAPGLYTCERDIHVYAGNGDRFTAAGTILATTPFSFAEDRGVFRAVTPVTGTMTVHSLWVKKDDLVSCRRSEARVIESARLEESLTLARAPEATSTSLELPRDIFQLALRYEAHAEYEMARDAYELAAHAQGTSTELTNLAEERSTSLSLLLGDLNAAERTLFRSGSPLDHVRPELVLELAQATQKTDSPKKTLELLNNKFLVTNRENLSRPALARLRSLRGRAYDSLTRTEDAEAEWNAVLEIAGAVFTNINSGASDRELALLTDLTGEALFRRASRLETEAERLRFPEFKGPNTKERITQFLGTQVQKWYSAKRDKLETVTDAYRLILEIQPIPPPRWVIAASVRVGTLWSDFESALKKAPIPPEWEKGIEIRTPYYCNCFESPEEPFRRLAKSAFAVALEWGSRFRIENQDTRAAEVWLANHYKSEYHLLDEFIPEATRSSGDSLPLAPLEQR